MDFKSLIKDGIAIIPQGEEIIPQDAFKNCSELKRIEIPDSVTKIGESAFYGCTGLTSIEIPNSVTKIGDHAFEGCTWLTSIKIPDSVTEIGVYAFQGCRGLASIKISKSVTEIGEGTFEDCIGLTNIEIPNSVTKIGAHAFFFCSGLTSIEIPNSVTTIEQDAFGDCTGLTSIEVPDSVTEIGEYAFGDCTGLTSIEIPNSVTTIGSEAFWGCTGLTSIEVPDSVTEIGEYAFGDCTGLTSIEIPNSVTTIGSEAFWGCTGLTSIEIPNSVTKIGYRAFTECYRLSDVYIISKNPTFAASLLDEEVFDESWVDKITLHVPIGTGYAYRHSVIGKCFKSIIADSDSRVRKAVKQNPIKTDIIGKCSSAGTSVIIEGGNTADTIIRSENNCVDTCEAFKSTASVDDHNNGSSVDAPSIHYLFFDTETTGLPKTHRFRFARTTWPRMVQLSWISQDMNGKTINKGIHIIRPEGYTIPIQASNIHGITTGRALEEGVSLGQALNEFLEDAKQAKVLVGHNVSFDMKILGSECVRLYGMNPIRDMSTIDTMEASTNYCAIPGYNGYKWPKLQELHRKLFGYDFEDAHDSGADIAATVKCFWEMRRRGLI